MNSAIVNIKVDPKIKKKAQNVAKELGLSLSGVLNAYLRHFVRTKTVHFSAEEPSEYLKKAIKEAEADIRAGKTTSFKNFFEEKAYLDKLIADEEKLSKG